MLNFHGSRTKKNLTETNQICANKLFPRTDCSKVRSLIREYLTEFSAYWNSLFYYPTVYIRSNCLFFATSWVTELFNRSINMTIDWHSTMGLVSRFPVKNTQVLIDMHDNDARTVRLWKETLCSNGKNKAWFGNFKLQ